MAEMDIFFDMDRNTEVDYVKESEYECFEINDFVYFAFSCGFQS